nr:MAG TPA: hypothetical protein [Caudoviricetes sp.]
MYDEIREGRKPRPTFYVNYTHPPIQKNKKMFFVKHQTIVFMNNCLGGVFT